MKFGDGPPIQICPGDVTISPAGGDTRYSLPMRGRHLCIHFLPHRRTSSMMSMPLHIRMGSKTQQVIELFNLASLSMMQYKLTGSDYAILSASTGLQRILTYLSEYANDAKMGLAGGRDYSIVDRLAEIIDLEYSEELSVPKLAVRVGMSQNYLARLFRERYGVTIPRYILTLRIEKAKELLEITDSPVGSIGQYVGLADPHYFNKTFRRITGVNPSGYRRVIRQRS